MLKKLLIIVCIVGLAITARSQASSSDTIPHPVPADSLNKTPDSLNSLDDASIDDLLNDMEAFMDSILTPHSYALLNLSAAQTYFNFSNGSNVRVKEIRKFIWSPTFGYYDKNGLGITLSAFAVHDSTQEYLYQGSITPSFDYLEDRRLALGVSYSKYFTRSLLPFYTSPLQNELNGYFLWRKSWLQPGIAASYGWGSKTEFKRREVIYRKLLATAANDGTIRVLDTVSILTKNRQSIVDLSMALSLRHDFYWLDIFSRKDHIRFSPLISLSGGTQRFGFNQTNTAFGNVRAVTLNNTRSVSLRHNFQLLSTTLYLRSEYAFGKFFIQPQVLFDYYLPGGSNSITTLFSINTGFIF